MKKHIGVGTKLSYKQTDFRRLNDNRNEKGGGKNEQTNISWSRNIRY